MIMFRALKRIDKEDDVAYFRLLFQYLSAWSEKEAQNIWQINWFPQSSLFMLKLSVLEVTKDAKANIITENF